MFAHVKTSYSRIDNTKRLLIFDADKINGRSIVRMDRREAS